MRVNKRSEKQSDDGHIREEAIIMLRIIKWKIYYVYALVEQRHYFDGFVDCHLHILYAFLLQSNDDGYDYECVCVVEFFFNCPHKICRHTGWIGKTWAWVK